MVSLLNSKPRLPYLCTSLLYYIERRAKEWWSTLPDRDRAPFHKMEWGKIPPKARETIMGLWIDSLEGVGFSEVKEDVLS